MTSRAPTAAPRPGQLLTSCPICGALVVDAALHGAFHDDLAGIARMLVDLHVAAPPAAPRAARKGVRRG